MNTDSRAANGPTPAPLSEEELARLDDMGSPTANRAAAEIRRLRAVVALAKECRKAQERWVEGEDFLTSDADAAERALDAALAEIPDAN